MHTRSKNRAQHSAFSVKKSMRHSQAKKEIQANKFSQYEEFSLNVKDPIKVGKEKALLNIGVECVIDDENGQELLVMQEIIKAGQQFPVTEEHFVLALDLNQFDVRIYQGNHNETKYNQLIAGLDIKFPPNSIKKNQKIFVALEISSRGQLTVRTRVDGLLGIGDSIQTRDFLEKQQDAWGKHLKQKDRREKDQTCCKADDKNS